MGWVVKRWRPEGVAALLDEQARGAARDVLETAEREARRWHRVARRERAVADDELQQLEAMGGELLQRVRLQRASIGSSTAPAPPDTGDIDVHDLRRPARPARRSRLRTSPLAALFAATDVRSTAQH